MCFIGRLDLKKFLSQKIAEQPGEIITASGKKIGEHQGLFWYTIGQRRGINIGGTGPYYVVEKNFGKNQLVVTGNPKDERLYSSDIAITDVSWVAGSAPDVSKTYEARIRYREPLSRCRLKDAGNGRYRVLFAKPQWAAASGQSVVVYEGEVCVVGGIIA